MKKFTEAILEATTEILLEDPAAFVMGLGVSYPNGADGTMGDLKIRFPERVLDTPVSEAALTGAALGAALMGKRPIIHHGRVEFALFAADQIFTQAAKWNYMFGGDYSPSLTIRIAVGRQWGNGPQHTQGLYALFGAVPGLRVVIPSTPFMAKALLKEAHVYAGPIVFLEPRWLYGIKGKLPHASNGGILGKSRIVREGSDVTIVTYGDGVLDSMKAAAILSEHQISAEVVDLVSLNPIDYGGVKSSIAKTKRVILVDTAPAQFSVGREVIGAILTDSNILLQHSPVTISTPNYPCPTAPSLVASYYPTRISIANSVLSMFSIEALGNSLSFEELHLSPKDEIDYV